jgi:hypothetical protein|nr:MAG TPA: hypothetical protein [Caudoviricetes sp.]
MAMKLMYKDGDDMVYKVVFAKDRSVIVRFNTKTGETWYSSEKIENINLFEYSEKYKMMMLILNSNYESTYQTK